MLINQAALRGLNISYSTAFQKAFDEITPDWNELATVVPSSTSQQDYKWLGQMPQMKEWIGEREVQSIAASGYSIKNKKFEMTIAVPRDDIEDDQYGIYTPLFSNMGAAAAQHPGDLIYGVMMDGFTGLCYDGKPFFAENHTIGEKTFSNKGTAELSTEAFEAARTSIMSITGDKGKPLKLVPNVLVVSPSNEKTARLILEADQINGTTNVNKGLAKVKVAPELAEHPDYWFLLCTNRPLRPFIFQKRKAIKFVSLTNEHDPNVFMNDEFMYGADGRSNAGYGFWQMAYGSTGTTKAQG